MNTLKQFKINGMVHNTGGGFYDNLPRVVPKGYQAVIRKDSWPLPAIFSFLQNHGNVPEAEMYRTFNMGIGMMAIVDGHKVNDICHHFNALGEKAYIIGEIGACKNGDAEVVLK